MMKVDLKLPVIPRNDLVLVRMDATKDQSNGGIYLPHGTQVSTGTVLAVGPGASTDNLSGCRMPMSLEVGERVYVAGDRFSVEFVECGVKMVLIPEKMILGSLPK